MKTTTTTTAMVDRTTYLVGQFASLKPVCLESVDRCRSFSSPLWLVGLRGLAAYVDWSKTSRIACGMDFHLCAILGTTVRYGRRYYCLY